MPTDDDGLITPEDRERILAERQFAITQAQRERHFEPSNRTYITPEPANNRSIDIFDDIIIDDGVEETGAH